MNTGESNVIATARLNKEWGVRLALIVLMFLGGGLYFLYDGLIGYPKQTQKYEMVYRMAEPKDGGEKRAVLRDDWKQRLEEAGYRSDINPRSLNYHSDWDIRTQLIIAALCLPIGLLVLFLLVSNSRKSLYADATGVRFGGKRMNYDEIESIDKDRWDSKGIAVLRGPADRKLVLDDWKFKGAADVLAAVEQRVGPEVSGADAAEPSASSADAGDEAEAATTSAEPSGSRE